MSAVTLADFRFGIESVADAPVRAQLGNCLLKRIRPMFGQRVLPVSEDVLFNWRRLVEEGRRTGHACSQPDLFITATALLHGLTVVSRDLSDYLRTGVAILHPRLDPLAGLPT